LELELRASQGLKRILAGFFPNESIFLEIEECEHIAYFFVAKDTRLKSLFFLEL